MSVSLRLDIKQSQGLVLTPQLQQAIKLLQYSNQELVDAVQSEAQGNPFVEVAHAGESSRTAKGLDDAGAPAAVPAPSGPASAPSDCRLGLRSLSRNRSDDDGLASAVERLTQKPGLREHLHAQIVLVNAPAAATDMAMMLAGMLDADGYLREGDNEIAEMLACDADEVAAGRQLLQRCEPVGVGARNLAECLRLQLQDVGRFDPFMERLLDRLPTLARADWAGLARGCGVERDELEEMVAEIKSLDPKPGSAFGRDEQDWIIPDMFIEAKRGGGWRLELNQAALPKVLVDEEYAVSIQTRAGNREEREFAQEKLQSANWLRKALEQRAKTMLRVGNAIFSRQRAFLANGPKGLKPLVLRDIAEATGLHESTVSRATTEKYIQTPHGTFALKYFFTTAIQSADGGGDHSAEAIRLRIKSMISAETADNILSDDQIVVDLRRDGIVLARRTVAKYREQLKIPSSVQRRRSKSLMAG